MKPLLPSLVPLLALCAAAACNKDTQSPPFIPGRLAFVSDRGRFGQFDIFAINADGTGLDNLTDSLAYDDGPAWSPDGTKLAFQSDRSLNAGSASLDIYVMNADGSNVVTLTTDTTREAQPAWSPDGTKIVFASDRTGVSHIYVMDANGANVTPLTSGIASDAQPAWSPDGTKIAFTTNRDGNDEVYVMNAADGTNPVNLSNNNSAFDDAPAWSPDGTKIAFMSSRTGSFAIHVMNADGSGVVPVTTSNVPDEYPSWSPDGAYIAFDSDTDLWVVKPDGSGLQRVTRGSTVIDYLPRWHP